MTHEEYLLNYRANGTIYWAGGVPWTVYRNVLRPFCHPHIQLNLQKGEISALLKKSKMPLAMWTNNYNINTSNWWLIVAERPYALELLRPKARYNVRRGLRMCDVRIISGSVLSEIGYECYKTAMERHVQSTPFDEATFQFKMARHNNNKACDIWGVFKDENLIGYAFYRRLDDVVYEGDVILNQEFFKYHSTYALLHATTEYYLNELKFSSIIAGERSISHETSWQEFTERDFLRRKRYCNLNIEYSKSYGILKNISYHLYPVISNIPIFTNIQGKMSLLYKLEKIIRQKDV